MSHHGEEPFDDRHRDMMRKLLDTASFRGATGHFPAGKMTKSDEGAIQFGVGEKDGKVVLEFGTPVAWIGMSPQEAADLAGILLKRAREVGRKQGQTIGFTLG